MKPVELRIIGFTAAELRLWLAITLLLHGWDAAPRIATVLAHILFP